jgi:hypothetical protein
MKWGIKLISKAYASNTKQVHLYTDTHTHNPGYLSLASKKVSCLPTQRIISTKLRSSMPFGIILNYILSRKGIKAIPAHKLGLYEMEYNCTESNSPSLSQGTKTSPLHDEKI